MIRRLGLAVLVISMVLAACGRQVTFPKAGTSNGTIPSGQMLIRFRTVAPQDYANVRYVIVFNTSGNGQEPFPQANQTGFQNYSFSFVVGGPNGLVGLPQLLQYYIAPGSSAGIQTIGISIPPNLVQFIPNSGGNGQGGEFQLTFSRALLYGVNPGGTGVPGAASPSANPSPTPAVAATSVPTATATLNPLVAPTSAAQQAWNINFVTTDQSGLPIDSMGLGGATDTSFSLNVNTTQVISTTYTKPQVARLNNQAAQISGYQLINSP